MKYFVPMDEKDQVITRPVMMEGEYDLRGIPDNVAEELMGTYRYSMSNDFWNYTGLGGTSEQPAIRTNRLCIKWFNAGHLEGIYVDGIKTYFPEQRAILRLAKQLREAGIERANDERRSFKPRSDRGCYR